MFQKVNSYDFFQAFKAYGRGNQFSYHALQALFDYFEELEESTGVEIELDVIGVCCDWTEYDSLVEAYADYNTDDELPEDEDDAETAAREFFEENTQVIDFDGRVLIAQF